MPATLLIIDDEPRLRELYARVLGLEGYTVVTAANLKQGLEQLKRHPEVGVVLSDVKLPDGNGIEALPKLREVAPQAEVVVVTAYGKIPDGIRAIKAGAFDYLTKGDSDDQLIVAIARAAEKAALRHKLAQLQRKQPQAVTFDTLIGQSPAFQQAVQQARQVAPTDAAVLLLGETGTGKEMLAQAIHAGSQRVDASFMAINCAAIPREMLESELFGYRKGAFTGAQADKDGLLKTAHQGTLFLDEIGELPLELQAKLLRVLDGGTFIRLGETVPTQVDLRIIAATNRDLKAEGAAGRFRTDLYYRLAVFTLELPALRQRPSDIQPLCEAFLSGFGKKLGKQFSQGLAPDVLAALQAYAWPGNVRELRNVMERAAILSPGERVERSHLPLDIAAQASRPMPEGETLAAAEAAHIRRIYHTTGGNKTETARRLGIALTTLYRKLEEYGL